MMRPFDGLLRLGFSALYLTTATGALATPTPQPPPATVDGAPSGRFMGPEGRSLPLKTDEEIAEFLRTASIKSSKVLGSGINRPLKLGLEKDRVEANAIFRTVDEKRDRVQLDDKSYRGFHDSYIYECAAYNLNRLLGLDHVPPCVRRSFRGKDGTIQLWIEDAMTEKDRREVGKEPPDPRRWARQSQTMYLFDALIFNFDRNQGNMLITPDWKLWFIDHTRSFRLDNTVGNLEKVVWCERRLWNGLQALDAEHSKPQLKPFLSPIQIKALFERRDLIVSYLRKLIDTRGEERVLYDLDKTQRNVDRD